jgi:hypothetical protein
MKTLKEYIVNENNFFKNLGIGIRPQIEKWLKENDIKNYTINDDLTINVKGDVNLLFYRNNEFPEYIQFGEVTGDFIVSGSSLVSLRGCPITIGGFFGCFSCSKLKSLKESPQKVGGSFYCNNCEKLTSLEGAS